VLYRGENDLLDMRMGLVKIKISTLCVNSASSSPGLLKTGVSRIFGVIWGLTLAELDLGDFAKNCPSALYHQIDQLEVLRRLLKSLPSLPHQDRPLQWFWLAWPEVVRCYH